MDFATVAGWIDDNPIAALWITIAAIGTFIVAIVAAPAAVILAPADHFQQDKRHRSDFARRRPALALGLRVIRNVLGWALIVAGVGMLILPGQGILTIIVGIALADVPGKYRLQRWLISRKSVLHAANKLRAKFNKPPLNVDHAGQSL